MRKTNPIDMALAIALVVLSASLAVIGLALAIRILQGMSL